MFDPEFSTLYKKPTKTEVPMSGEGPNLEYKVVESSEVTDVAIERILNAWTGNGWTFSGMQFAMRETSKRPSMVFVLFTRGGQQEILDQRRRAL